MKYVLSYEAAPDFMSKVMAHIDAHWALWKQFAEAGTLLMIGPFTDPPAGSAMGIFTTHAAADAGVGLNGGESDSSIDGVIGSDGLGDSTDAAVVKFACGGGSICTLGSQYCAIQDPSTYRDPYSYYCKTLPACCGATDCSCLCPKGSCPTLTTSLCRCRATESWSITVECTGE
jgi:uncharacterized protein YciI